MATYPPFVGWALHRSSGSYPFALSIGTALVFEFASSTPQADAGDQYEDPTVASHPASVTDADVTVRWSWEDTGTMLPFASARGVGILVRLGDAGAPGYHVSARATTGNVTLTALGAGTYATGSGELTESNVVASVTVPFTGFVEATPYCLRVAVNEVGDKLTRFRARVWAAADAEPTTWALDATLDGDAGTPNERARWTAGPGPIGVSTAGEGSISTGGAYPPGARGRRYTVHEVIVHGPPAGRIRSSVSEDAGSLFQATQAAAVELGLSEAFEYGEGVPAGWLRSFREALTSDDTAVSYYPLPTRNQEMLVTVEGETNLGRLAGVYPSGIMVPASAIPGASGGVVTAQQAIQHVTNQWASEHPWLSFAPIPDLRLMVPGAVAAPRQHYIDNPGDGVLTTAAVVIPQEGNERRSMREILDEWLAIFPGTIIRQTSSGVIELVPRVGPDAPSGAAATLTWGDLTGISDGEDDPSGVTNRCRVTSQGWEFTPNQALIAPSFVLVRAANGVTRAVLDGENVLPTGSREEHSIYDDLVFTGLTAPTAATVDVVIHAYGSWSPTTSSSFSLEGTATRQVTLAAGQAQDVTITHNSRSQDVTATFRLRRSADGGRIAVSAPGGIPESAGNPFGRTWFAYVLDVDVTGTAWVRSNERVESEFGQTGTALPGAGGGDALADSRALYGERLAVINSNVFQLTNEQAQLVARSYVLANINPRTIRDVQQSEWNKYPVRFDHIGRYVDLPTGERAVIENRSYSDSFSSTHGAMASSFSASVTEIVIDTSTDWLLLDNGDFFQLDNGDLLEVS